MKAYFFSLLIIVGACFGVQLWFYLGHLVKERTRPFHERQDSSKHS
jgi:hypothetical protein